jgi:hypothetical protein
MTALMPVRVDAREVWVVGVTLEMLTMQWERPRARLPAAARAAYDEGEDEGTRLYSAFQLAHFEAGELEPFLAERVWLDPPARDAGDVYKRTGTGLRGTRRLPWLEARTPAERTNLPADMVLEWQPFVRLVDVPPGGPSRWIRLDAHLQKEFVDVVEPPTPPPPSSPLARGVSGGEAP